MKRTLENLFGIAAGIVIGALGVLIHNFTFGFFPFGLAIALLGGFSASKILGERYGRRGIRFWFLVGWTLVTVRGATFGNGDELLIMSNGAGNTFLALGFLLMLVSIWSRL
jgi:hypothetical protein